MDESKFCYLCDPEKNTGCKKQFCAYNPEAVMRACYSTLDKEYARLDFAGQPVLNPDMSKGIGKRVKENFEEEGPIIMPAEYLDAQDMGIPNGGYKDPKWTNLAKEIANDAEDKGLPWYAGLFNPKIFQGIESEQRKKEGSE